MATEANGASFESCIWGNHFLVYNDPGYTSLATSEAVRKEHEELKEEIKRMIVKIQTTPVTSKSMISLKERLRFLDTLQRLGVSFYFEKEITKILQRVRLYDDFSSSEDLYIVSTAFRLLRDQGIYVPTTGMFEKFVDQIAQSNDVDGLLGLYEATYYAIPDEDILDQAQELAANRLKEIMPELKRSNQTQFDKVEHVLYRSIRRNSDRLVARFYIDVYRNELTFGESLLKFAVHDYNIRQAIFQKELATLTKWVEDSYVKTEVPFSRHRFVEFYFWAVCVFPEPHYNIARITVTKLFFMMTVIDDVYDTYGTMEELEVFTEAFARLDPNVALELPSYMKVIISKMNELYAELETYNPGRPYVVNYLKREYEKLVRAYEDDARWIHSNIVPSYKEYFDVIMTTAGMTIFHSMYFTGMGEVITEEVMSWAIDDPVSKCIETVGLIARLTDDLSPCTNEVDKPQTGARVYMKHYGVPEKEAREIMMGQVTNAYKELNKMLLKGLTKDTIGVPEPILKVMCRHIQGCDIFNRDHDSYSFPKLLKEAISSVFIESMVM